MNKKVNTILFLLGATLFNIIITILCFAVLFLAYIKFVMEILPEEGRAWGFPLIFIAAIAFSFFIYRLLLKLMLKKLDAEKYFDPILGRRRKN